MSATLNGVSEMYREMVASYLHCSAISGGCGGREGPGSGIVDWMNFAISTGSDAGPNWFSM
jgi:hypothetical protein